MVCIYLSPNKDGQDTHSPLQINELEEGYRSGKIHVLRQRCHIVLLKLQGHTARQIAVLKGYPKHQGTINNWVSRYEKLGMSGLKNKKRQGRKPILDKETQRETVEKIVHSERQRLNQAKALIEKTLQVSMSKKTLTRFLKVLAVSTNE